MRRDDVLVVGAGPVGLVAALGLARAGVAVTVLDAAPEVPPAAQVLVLRWPTLPVLDGLGVLDDLRRAAVQDPCWSYHVLRTGEQLVVDLGLLAGDVAHPYNLHLSDAALRAVLLRHLARHTCVTVHHGTRVSDVVQDRDGVSVLGDGPDGPQVHRAGWLVGADGVHSTVRRCLGLGFAGMTWPEHLVSVWLDVDFSAFGYLAATYQLDPRFGALVARADRDGPWCYVYAESRSLPATTIGRRIPAVLRSGLPGAPEVTPLCWSTSRVHERTAERLRSGRVILAGDAAHVVNPTGHVGLANGVVEAARLAEVLAQVAGGSAAGSRLDRWAQEREHVFRTMVVPLSSDTMNLVFDTERRDRLDAEVDHIRAVIADQARLREFLLLSSEVDALPSF